MVPERAAASISCAPPILPEPQHRSIASSGKRSARSTPSGLSGSAHKAPRRWSLLSALPTSARWHLLSASLLPVLALLPCPGGASASPTNSSRQGYLSWFSKRRGAESSSCRGFGVFAAAAGKWIRQDVMGDRSSFHVLVAEPRLLLKKGHTMAHVIQFCVCHGPASTRGEAETRVWWRRSAALIRSACQASLPLVVLCDANAGWSGYVAGNRRPGRGLGGHRWRGVPYVAA